MFSYTILVLHSTCFKKIQKQNKITVVFVLCFIPYRRAKNKKTSPFFLMRNVQYHYDFFQVVDVQVILLDYPSILFHVRMIC